MLVQVNTDRNIAGHEKLISYVEESVTSRLSRFSDRITRVEVHFSDENGKNKAGTDDHRCLIEARIEGRSPLAVSDQAAALDEAMEGALTKLVTTLDSTFDRMDERR